ncbi:MAG: hypothetical protein AAGG55_04080 [Pseudomonadota bacterium]
MMNASLSRTQHKTLRSASRKGLQVLAAGVLCLGLTGCDDPQIYGSVGVSSGYGGYYGGYGGWGAPRMHTSISIGGRIR